MSMYGNFVNRRQIVVVQYILFLRERILYVNQFRAAKIFAFIFGFRFLVSMKEIGIGSVVLE